MRPEPIRHWRDFVPKQLPQVQPPLNAQVTTLAERRKVPAGVVGRVVVEVVDRQHMVRDRVIRMAAPLATPRSALLHVGRNRRPIGGVTLSVHRHCPQPHQKNLLRSTSLSGRLFPHQKTMEPIANITPEALVEMAAAEILQERQNLAVSQVKECLRSIAKLSWDLRTLEKEREKKQKELEAHKAN